MLRIKGDKVFISKAKHVVSRYLTNVNSTPPFHPYF